MTDDINTNKNRIQTPTLIYVACILGFLNTVPTLLLWTTELAYMVGEWYKNFLLLSSLLIWISLAGIMFMRRWAVVIFSLTITVTQIILYKYNDIWSYTSLIVPVIVILAGWFYFKKMR